MVVTFIARGGWYGVKQLIKRGLKWLFKVPPGACCARGRSKSLDLQPQDNSSTCGTQESDCLRSWGERLPPICGLGQVLTKRSPAPTYRYTCSNVHRTTTVGTLSIALSTPYCLATSKTFPLITILPSKLIQEVFNSHKYYIYYVHPSLYKHLR